MTKKTELIADYKSPTFASAWKAIHDRNDWDLEWTVREGLHKCQANLLAGKAKD